NEGFLQFAALVRAFPRELRTPEIIAPWYFAALSGLVWATPPPARVRPAAALAVWTVMNAGVPDILPVIVEATEQVMKLAAPSANTLDAIVAVAAETLAEVVPPAQVAQRMVEFLTPLDQARREAAMRAFLRVGRPQS